MALHEITIKATKTIYVEAESAKDALNHPIVQEEQGDSMQGIEWDVTETEADELEEFIADGVRRDTPKLVFDQEI